MLPHLAPPALRQRIQTIRAGDPHLPARDPTPLLRSAEESGGEAAQEQDQRARHQGQRHLLCHAVGDATPRIAPVEADELLPSAELASWATLLQPKKGGKKAPTASKDESLHIPLQWLFLPNSAAPFAQTATASRAQLSSFSTLLQLVHQSAQLWQQVPCYAELFTPLMDVLGHILSQQRGAVVALPTVLQQYTQHLHQYLSGSVQHAISLRTPLEASLAPLALKQHNPLFVEGYNPTKDYDPVKERAAAKELSHKLKREKKGALRELRGHRGGGPAAARDPGCPCGGA